ncbi:MAG: YbaK/EbsC family protein, partial [Elstera sp.]
MSEAFFKLQTFLSERGTAFRLTEHAPEGQTDRASALRGHALAESAKSMVTEVRTPGQQDRYFLAVVPGHRRVDFKRIEALTGGKKARLAPAEIACA